MPDSSVPPEVKVAAPSEAEQAIATLALAFANDPMARWSLPDPATYLTYFPPFARAFGGKAFDHGTAHVVANAAGAALWLPAGVAPDSETMGAIMQDVMPPARRADGFTVVEQMESYHPHEPHWYLPLIGVDPRCQGTGLGSALLAYALARCDAEGLPAYLESSNPMNQPLYERHGFVALGTIQEGSSPALVPMLRKPR